MVWCFWLWALAGYEHWLVMSTCGAHMFMHMCTCICTYLWYKHHYRSSGAWMVLQKITKIIQMQIHNLINLRYVLMHEWSLWIHGIAVNIAWFCNAPCCFGPEPNKNGIGIGLCSSITNENACSCIWFVWALWFILMGCLIIYLVTCAPLEMIWH